MGNIVDRLKEGSSWASIAVALGAVGVSIPSDLWSVIVQAGMAVSVVIAFFVKDRGNGRGMTR